MPPMRPLSLAVLFVFAAACGNDATPSVPSCSIGGQQVPSGALNPANSCQQCTPASSSTAYTQRADGTSCNPGQICSAGACAAGCFIGGVLYSAGDANPADACEVCTPATSTAQFTPRASVPLLVATENIATEGWTLVSQAPSDFTPGPDYIRLATSTTNGAVSGGQLLVSRAHAIDPAKPFKIDVTLMVESVTNHNKLDSAAAIMGSITGPFGNQMERSEMIYLDNAAIGWADDSQSAPFTVTDGAYHVYELAVDAAKNATVSVDGVVRLTRPNYSTNGTIAIGDQTNEPTVDGAMRIRSVVRVCP